MLTRRALLKGAALSAGALIRIDAGAFDVAAQEVSPTAVRLLFLPRASAAARHVPDDGALVRQEWPERAVGRPARHGVSELEVEVAQDRTVLGAIRSSARPAAPRGPERWHAVVPARARAPARPRRRRTAVRSQGIDRRDAERPGGVRLRTHGGRVPIQWLVGTDGWGVYVHRPLGAFDFTGFRRSASARPTCCLSTCSSWRRVSRPPSCKSRLRGHHRPGRIAGAVDVWLHAVAPHARRTRRSAWGRAVHSARRNCRATR